MQFNPDPQIPLSLLQACPAYTESPLTQLKMPSDVTIFVKNEGQRMSLGSFKALGGVYAVARLISDAWEQQNGRPLSPAEYQDPIVRKCASAITFVCASAGNHGLAVAAGARVFGAKSRIYLSNKVPIDFEKRLVQYKAEVIRAGTNYEESMQAAIKDAEATGDVLVSDSTWPGYIKPASLVMEGYTVIAEELRHRFSKDRIWPSHVYLQAGVGGFAGSLAHMIRKSWSVQPKILIVEPEAAPCLMESHRNDRAIEVTGPASNMGRLDCKVPSILSVNILKHANVEYCTVSDTEAQQATDFLAQKQLPTTPSGAAGLAGFLKSSNVDSKRESIRPLIFVTECALD